jgi:hypothetical protein
MNLATLISSASYDNPELKASRWLEIRKHIDSLDDSCFTTGSDSYIKINWSKLPTKFIIDHCLLMWLKKISTDIKDEWKLIDRFSELGMRDQCNTVMEMYSISDWVKNHDAEDFFELVSSGYKCNDRCIMHIFAKPCSFNTKKWFAMKATTDLFFGAVIGLVSGPTDELSRIDQIKYFLSFGMGKLKYHAYSMLWAFKTGGIELLRWCKSVGFNISTTDFQILFEGSSIAELEMVADLLGYNFVKLRTIEDAFKLRNLEIVKFLIKRDPNLVKSLTLHHIRNIIKPDFYMDVEPSFGFVTEVIKLIFATSGCEIKIPHSNQYRDYIWFNRSEWEVPTACDWVLKNVFQFTVAKDMRDSAILRELEIEEQFKDSHNGLTRDEFNDKIRVSKYHGVCKALQTCDRARCEMYHGPVEDTYRIRPCNRHNCRCNNAHGTPPGFIDKRTKYVGRVYPQTQSVEISTSNEINKDLHLHLVPKYSGPEAFEKTFTLVDAVCKCSEARIIFRVQSALKIWPNYYCSMNCMKQVEGNCKYQLIEPSICHDSYYNSIKSSLQKPKPRRRY